MLRFLAFIIYSTVVFFLPNSLCLLLLLPINLIIFILANRYCHVTSRQVLIGVLKFLPFILLTFVFNLWLGSLAAALWLSYKLMVVCSMTMIYAGTTTTLEVATTVEQLFTPLRIFHMETSDIKILVCISLSLLPVLRQQWQETRLACAAKHLPLTIHNTPTILVRYLSAVFSRVEQIEAALLAKGYQQ